MQPTNKRSLVGVRELLIDPDLRKKDSQLVQKMFELGGAAADAAALISEAAEETVGGIMANALSHMSWLNSKGMQRMYSSSDLAPEKINDGKTTVYYKLPPEMQTTHQRSTRLIVNMFMNAAFKNRKKKGFAPTLFIFDEAYSTLGNLPLVKTGAAIIRGYFGRIWMIFQNKGQVDELFGKNAETFFANAGQVQVFAINDEAGQKYVEARLGPRVLWRKKVTRTPYGDVAEYEPTAAFSLRGSEEVGRATGRSSGLQIVLNEGGDPFLLRRTPYRKMFKRGQYDPDPYEPQSETLREKALRLARLAIVKIKEWRQ